MIGVILGFLGTPLGKVAAVAVVAAGIYGTGYLRGYSKADRACESEALRARIAAMERDADIARNAERAAKVHAADLDRMASDLLERVTSYEHALASRPEDDVCRLTDDDIGRLRGK